MIEPLAGFRESVLAFACHGRVTRSDYENVLIPAIQRVLSNHAKARLYYETSADFTGIGPGRHSGRPQGGLLTISADGIGSPSSLMSSGFATR